MMRELLTAIAIGGAAFLGCGGGGGGTTGTGGAGGAATCASNAACGGDIVGTWTIVHACNLTTTLPPNACAERTYTVSNQAQTGTLVFRADGTATETLRATGTIKELTPPACLASAMETCTDIDASFKDLVLTGSSYTAASCADSAGTCECTLTFDTTSNVSATYTTSESTVTVTSNGSGNLVTYCATGSTLIISSMSTTGDPPAVYVLARQ